MSTSSSGDLCHSDWYLSPSLRQSNEIISQVCKAALIRGMHHLNLQCDLSAREMCACLTRQWALLEQDRLISALSVDSVQRGRKTKLLVPKSVSH